jgi:hypothetical protein
MVPLKSFREVRYGRNSGALNLAAQAKIPGNAIFTRDRVNLFG